MNCSSVSPPPRKNSERSSKSSNSFSRTGMMWPGTFSRISGFSREPRRPFLGVASVVGAVGSIEPRNIPKPGGISDYWLFCAAMPEVAAAEAKQLIDSGAQAADVRTDVEHEAGHIPGSRHIPLANVPAESPTLDKGRPVLLYCRS